MFQIKKEKAAEAALNSIRDHLGPAWESLTAGEIAALAHILGEMWSVIEREEWSAYIFSSLTVSDVRALIRLGEDTLRDLAIGRDVIGRFRRIMRHALS